MPGFVIEYHRSSGDFRVTEFPGETGVRDAVQRRLDLEGELQPGGDWEIVALSADSIDVLRRTHSRYFQGTELIAV